MRSWCLLPSRQARSRNRLSAGFDGFRRAIQEVPPDFRSSHETFDTRLVEKSRRSRGTVTRQVVLAGLLHATLSLPTAILSASLEISLFIFFDFWCSIEIIER